MPLREAAYAYSDGVTERGAASTTRWNSRPGRAAVVVGDLSELRGPRGGVVELPHRMVWQPRPTRRFDLDDPYQRRRAYAIVLREAVQADDLREWLDGETLRRVWTDLYLPSGVRRAWESRHPDLARLRAAA